MDQIEGVRPTVAPDVLFRSGVQVAISERNCVETDDDNGQRQRRQQAENCAATKGCERHVYTTNTSIGNSTKRVSYGNLPIL